MQGCKMINNPVFPIWQIDQQEYNAICSYLDISSQPVLFDKLADYLLQAPFAYIQPKGFALFLAKPGLSKFRIARLDLLSKVLYKDHPIRFILNAVIALHECDGKGYVELSAAPTGWQLPISLAWWGAGFALSLVITSVWFFWEYTMYLLQSPFQAKNDLTGQRILITGASRGLGLEILLYALQQGAEVVSTVRSQAAHDELMALLPAEAPVQLIIADLAQANAVTAALQENKISPESIDIAVLCAGLKHSDTSVLSLEQLRETFEVNCFSNIELSKWLCSSEHKTVLVLISSIGRWHGMHSSAGYNASKAALSIWAESLEMELHSMRRKDCNILIVEPGIFESGMMQKTASSKFLFASRRKLAEKIISGALSGRKTLRYPYWFALLTWTICLAGRNFQNYFFARASKSIKK